MRIGWKAAVHDPKVASFRFRVAAPLAALAARGHAVELFDPARADSYDLVILCKSYGPADQALAGRVKARGGRVALDLCDNHFYNPYRLPRYGRARADLLATIALADRVIVSTPALAAVVQGEAGVAPAVVGDVAERIVLPPRTPAATRMLLWFGSHGSPNAPAGMNDLLAIRAPLARAAARVPFELVVASNSREKYDALAPQLGLPSRYVEWTAEGFPALLAAADGVVIPIADNPFAACKTHNRMTTTLWPGVPVIADRIESYAEFAPFAWLDDWDGGLRAVLDDGGTARRRAAGARAHIDAHWSIERLAPLWEQALGLEPATVVKASAPLRKPERGPLHQGALDAPRPDRITGWARLISQPGHRVQIMLEADGEQVAHAIADEPRADLAAAGFPNSRCGFTLAIPPAWADGRDHGWSVIADGEHVIETQRIRFAPMANAVAPLGQQLEALGELAAAIGQAASPSSRIQDEVRLQKTLADELEVLNEAVETVRRVAARIVLVAGGGIGSGDQRP